MSTATGIVDQIRVGDTDWQLGPGADGTWEVRILDRASSDVSLTVFLGPHAEINARTYFYAQSMMGVAPRQERRWG